MKTDPEGLLSNVVHVLLGLVPNGSHNGFFLRVVFLGAPMSNMAPSDDVPPVSDSFNGNRERDAVWVEKSQWRNHQFIRIVSRIGVTAKEDTPAVLNK